MITPEKEKRVKLKKQITQILGWIVSGVALYFVYQYVDDTRKHFFSSKKQFGL